MKNNNGSPSFAQLESTTIHRYRYSRFDGVYFGSVYRFVNLVRFQLVDRLWDTRSFKASLLLLGFMWFMVCFPFIITMNLFWSYMQYASIDPEQFYYQYSEIKLELIIHEVDNLWNFVSAVPYSLALWMYAALVTGSLFSPDYENRTVEDYFCRISRLEYLIGKLVAAFLAIAIPLCLLTLATHFWFASAMTGTSPNFSQTVDPFEWNNFLLLIKMLLWMVLIAAVLTLLGAALSCFLTSNYASIMYFIVLFLTYSFSFIFARSYLEGTEVFYLFNFFISAGTMLNAFIGRPITDYLLPWPSNPDFSLMICSAEIIFLLAISIGGIINRVLHTDP